MFMVHQFFLVTPHPPLYLFDEQIDCRIHLLSFLGCLDQQTVGFYDSLCDMVDLFYYGKGDDRLNGLRQILFQLC